MPNARPLPPSCPRTSGKLKKTEPVGRQGYMGELGMNAELAKAAFAAKVNDGSPWPNTLDGRARSSPAWPKS